MNYLNAYGKKIQPCYMVNTQKNDQKDGYIRKYNNIINNRLIITGTPKQHNKMQMCARLAKDSSGEGAALTGTGAQQARLKLSNLGTSELKNVNFKKRLYTSYSKFTEVKLVTISIASPLRILQWAEKTLPNGKIYGEVLNANTLHHKTFKPQKGGLFCERIFGPLKDFECSCGKIDKSAKYSLKENKYKNTPQKNGQNIKQETVIDNIEGQKDLALKNEPSSATLNTLRSGGILGDLSSGSTLDKSKTTRKLRKFCPDCDVEYTWSVIRRYQLGYIKLISPVTHIWFLKGTPSYLSILLDIKKRFLQSIAYCSETLTIEHSESAVSALQSYKISGLDLDSPSKIYALWSNAKNKETISNSEINEISEINKKNTFNKKAALTGLLQSRELTDNLEKNTVLTDSNISLKLIKEKIQLDRYTRRINTINKWKESKEKFIKNFYEDNWFSSVLMVNEKFTEKIHQKNEKNENRYNSLNLHHKTYIENFLQLYSLNKNKIFSIKKNYQLLCFFQKRNKDFPVNKSSIENNLNRLNLRVGNLYANNLPDNLNSSVRIPDRLLTSAYMNLKTSSLNTLEELGFSNTDIRIFLIQFYYIFQLGIIYDDLIINLFSCKTYKNETSLVQKTLYEKPLLLKSRDFLYKEDSDNNFINNNMSNNTFKEEVNLNNTFSNLETPPSRDPSGRAVFQKVSPYELGTSAGFYNIINQMNRKSPIDLYIKSSLQRMLYKKIVIHSIVETWQKMYKKAYIKAMYKTISSFSQKNKVMDGKIKNTPEVNINYKNLNIYMHYIKINKLYSNKECFKYLKDIIFIVKSYFKKNVILSLKNIKQPIFNVNYPNAKNNTIQHTTTLLTNKMLNTQHVWANKKDMSFCPTDIPIPFSISQLINKKSEELTDFLSLESPALVNLLAEKGFMAPLIVGKFYEISNYKNIFVPDLSAEVQNPPQSKKLENPYSSTVSPFGMVSQTESIFLSPLGDGRPFENWIFTRQKENNFNLKNFSKEKKQNFAPFTNVKGKYKRNSFKIAKSLFKGNINLTHLNNPYSERVGHPHGLLSKLLTSRLVKQPYYDLGSINNGKYYIKENDSLYSPSILYSIKQKLLSERKNIENKEYSINKNYVKGENYDIEKIPFFNLRLNSNLYSQVPRYKENNNTFLSENNNVRRIFTPQKTKKKRLYNNVYTLSHRERWGSRVNEGKDWQIFLLYNTAVSNSKDKPIFVYKDRTSSMMRTSSNFNFQLYGSSPISQNSSIGNTLLLQSRAFKSDTPYSSYSFRVGNSGLDDVLINNSFFSGPGIIQQLLSELTFSEMKKLDKQNRLLLYVLNKSIFKLKKHIKIFIYDKTSQVEMRELCKKRDLLIRRTKLVRKLFRKESDPSSMILTVLPVLPPDLRPIVKMGNQIAASDLNRFYQRVIYRNDRLKKFLKDPATSHSYEMKYAQRLLQEAVDNLIQNSQTNGEKDSRGRALKSLSDILKGKQGRFRQFLLGKRVDYSGRSVIVVGPKLKLYECGIPLEMALELYLPFLLKIILNKNYAKTVVGAKSLIKTNRPLALELLREIMQVSPVLLNRAPTLHRLGFQAFVPKLVEGRAILLHPLVCSSFNADFDGDQMAVHVPITIEARAEAWKLMLSRNNILSPATGDPLSIPSQDMVLGCYYLTTNSNKATLSLLRGSGLFFTNLEKVLYAYNLQQIDLHALVWVKWSGLIENGNDQEEPLEIRVSTMGDWQELSYNYIRYFDSSAQLIYQYMSTTPGRILFHSLIKKF